MEQEAFARSKGEIRIGGTGYFYFVPPRLPRKLSYTENIVQALSQADHQVGQLQSLSKMIPNPQRFIYPYMVREAVLSSKIEGTRATASDVFLSDAAKREKSISRSMSFASDVLEVNNYVKAQNHGFRTIKANPLDLELLRALHGILLKGVRGEDRDPGHFRRSQNWIGADRMEDAPYVPPEPGAMAHCLKDLETFMAMPASAPVLLQAALLHYQFEAIHPFRDGNGRIGRLMIALWLTKHGLLGEPLLYLSAYFERNRKAYYDALLRVSQEGDYERWYVFFLRGVVEEAQDAVARAHKLVAHRERNRRLLQDHGATPGALRALEDLYENPYTNASIIAGRLRISFPAALRAVGYLEKAGIIREITGAKRNRVYVAHEILANMERPAIRRQTPERGQRQLSLST